MTTAGPGGDRPSESGALSANHPDVSYRVTLPAWMQEVHTLSFLGVLPVLPTIARTVWMLGFQRRFVRRCEWEML